ncbi:DUF6907 domain-containing protein [Micromonospora chersina]|uniref:DUF6907 domain-containing protein n=1 Tax=Micromonospora chersina TaxID=47854 RepID=UPI0037199D00
MKREDYGWRDDSPCPDWCVKGEEHLDSRLRSGSDFWHTSKMTDVETADTDHNWEPHTIGVGLSQHEHVDERGHYRHQVQVVVSAGGEERLFSIEQARALASVLMERADEAERLSADLRPRQEN